MKTLSRIWESWKERLAKTPEDGTDQPLPGINHPNDPDFHREGLSFVAPAIGFPHLVKKSLAEARQLRDESAVRQRVQQLNDQIARCHANGVAGTGTTAAPIDVEAFVERWQADRKP